MTDDNPDCPWCNKPVPTRLGFDTLGEEFDCPHCGKRYGVDGEHISDEAGWSMWLTCTTLAPESNP